MSVVALPTPKMQEYNQRRSQGTPELRLTTMPGTSTDQLFFLAFAAVSHFYDQPLLSAPLTSSSFTRITNHSPLISLQ